LALALAVGPAGCSATPLDVVYRGRSDAAAVSLDAGSELAPPPHSDLVAHWSFDEGTGNIAHDDSGNAYHGHLVGGTWVTGRFGRGLAILPNDYVAVDGFQDATPAWTVSVWLRLGSREVHGSWGSVLSTELDAEGGWMVYLEGDPGFAIQRLNFEFSRPNAHSGPTGCCTGLTADTWYHVTVVTDAAAGRILFYEGTTLMSTSSIAATLSPGDPTLFMGKWRELDTNPNIGGYLSGTIDDVAIFSRALSPAEIAALDVAPVVP
jgi:hypothetical protein